MIPIPRCRALLGILSAAISLAIATGCQPHAIIPGLQGHSIVARLGNRAIDEDAYIARMQRVGLADFQQTMQSAGRQSDPNLDAGAIALISLLRESAVEQLAEQMHVTPSEDMIDQEANYERRANPQLDKAIKGGTLSEADYKRSLRLPTEVVEIGTDGAHVDDKDLQAAFQSKKKDYDIPERLGLRLLRVKDETDGTQVLLRLKATGDFKAEESQEHSPYPFSGDENFISADQLKSQAKPLWDAISNLSAGSFAPSPINIGRPGTPPVWIVVQVTQKLPAQSVTLDQVRIPLTLSVLQQKFPEYQVHFLQKLNEFLQSSALDIYIERYKSIVLAYLLTPPAATMSPGGMAAPSGGGGAPGQASPGTTPPSGAGATPGGSPGP